MSARSFGSRAVRSATLRRIALVLLLVLLYQVWLGVQAVGKAEPGIGDAPDERGRFDVDVVLGFQPERYHFLKLQDHGRVAGTTDTTVHLRGVSPAGVDALAREYWIESLAVPDSDA
ncbi:hypothetical protein [Nocardiopsis sp. L17-MgMaSL7]|uniref:hypothetical protein n=1 Tax=Nocardiopsis sp. L17-MgMaSL7 TaxID=1938893 RepID=UPI000D709215|nr:hypothetical protein [Nocardiopsis sp. L17-MgMaSL7]PWV44709.1 hypothetical protein BDW27_12257 [Nocardiopsis sp. L17-MgMaSL7]